MALRLVDERFSHLTFSVSSLTPAETSQGLPGGAQSSQDCDQWPRRVYRENIIESLKRVLK